MPRDQPTCYLKSNIKRLTPFNSYEINQAVLTDKVERVTRHTVNGYQSHCPRYVTSLMNQLIYYKQAL